VDGVDDVNILPLDFVKYLSMVKVLLVKFKMHIFLLSANTNSVCRLFVQWNHVDANLLSHFLINTILAIGRDVLFVID